MLTERLPNGCKVPIIRDGFVRPRGASWDAQDWGYLLRYYLREVLYTINFFAMCRDGYLADTVARAVPQGVRLAGEIPQGVGLALETPRNGASTPYVEFFIARVVAVGVRGSEAAALYVLQYADEARSQVRLRELQEAHFFEALEAHGIARPRALRLVDEALWKAAIAEDRLEPTATRLQSISAQIKVLLEEHGHAWC